MDFLGDSSANLALLCLQCFDRSLDTRDGTHHDIGVLQILAESDLDDADGSRNRRRDIEREPGDDASDNAGKLGGTTGHGSSIAWGAHLTYNGVMQKSVVFLGTSAFAVPALKALAKDDRFKIELVITQPDRPTGRKQVLTPPPLKVAALELNLKVEQPESLNQEFGKFQSLIPNPEFLVVVAYGQILSQDVLDWPTVAAVNVHGSLLPLLRGASPVHHAILQDFKETGVTVQKMAKELDSGPILSQASVTLDARETFTTLHDKLADIGSTLLIDTLTKPLKPIDQDHSKATFCSKLKKSDGIADTKTMTATQIDRMIRALTPWPGVTIGASKILETSLEPVKDALSVPCADGTTLFVTRLQPSSGKPMSGREFSSGRTL